MSILEKKIKIEYEDIVNNLITIWGMNNNNLNLSIINSTMQDITKFIVDYGNNSDLTKVVSHLKRVKYMLEDIKKTQNIDKNKYELGTVISWLQQSWDFTYLETKMNQMENEIHNLKRDIYNELNEIYNELMDLKFKYTKLEFKYNEFNMRMHARPFENVRISSGRSKHNVCLGGVWGARKDKSGTYGRF